MSIYYKDGELSKVIFSDEPVAASKPHWYDIGTHIIFPKVYLDTGSLVSVHN